MAIALRSSSSSNSWNDLPRRPQCIRVPILWTVWSHDIEIHLLQGLRGTVYRVGTTDEVELLVCPYIGHLGQYSRPILSFW
jgi:hypothetical protein